MTDKNELVTSDYSANLPAVSMGSDDGFDDLAKGSDFLGRLQLFSKGNAVGSGLIAPGNWGVPRGDDQITCIGKSVDCIPFARRPKAIDLSDVEAIITNYDMESKEFQRIADESLKKDSGCMYGPSFLVYERSTGNFLEWFCGTKSTRTEAKKIYPFLTLTAEDIDRRNLQGVEPHGPLPFTMTIKFIKKKRFSWHAPVVVPCSTPFSNGPALKKVIFEMERFLNPSDAGVEKDTDDDEDEGSRAR
jgi:hypothetical protein